MQDQLVPAPWHIPPKIANFVGRISELESALRRVERQDDPDRPAQLNLVGYAGVGKTELAYEIVRRLKQNLHDGAYYVDLDELRRDGVVAAADVLETVLRALGVTPDMLAPTLSARRGQFLDLTKDRWLAIVLDNARYASEMVPLLPASAHGVVIVVSHGQLRDAEYDIAESEMPVPPLGDEDALRLLTVTSGDDRLPNEPTIARGFVSLCSGLPRALRVVGGWIRPRRHRDLGDLLAELTASTRTAGLPDREHDLERVWDAAYAGLSTSAKPLYRLLAVSPGPTITPAALTALLGQGQQVASSAMVELIEAGLLDVAGGATEHTGRFRLPELIRAHADRCARRDGDPAHLEAGLRRVVRWYLRQAQRADLVLAGERMTFAPRVPESQDAPDVGFGAVRDGVPDGDAASVRAAKAAALRWLDAERNALFAAVRDAYAAGMDTEAWSLCEPLFTYRLDHPHPADDVEADRTGLAAAQRDGHVTAIIRMRCQLARSLWEQQQFDLAEVELRQALNAVEAAGDQTVPARLRASVFEFDGGLRAARGDWAAAVERFEASKRVHEHIGNAYGETLMTYRIGQAAARLGELERAARLLTRAHTGMANLRRERMIGRTGLALGEVLHALGRPDEAEPLYAEALDGARRRDARREQVRVLTAWAALAADQGDDDRAARFMAEARQLREAAGLGGEDAAAG